MYKLKKPFVRKEEDQDLTARKFGRQSAAKFLLIEVLGLQDIICKIVLKLACSNKSTFTMDLEPKPKDPLNAVRQYSKVIFSLLEFPIYQFTK